MESLTIVPCDNTTDAVEAKNSALFLAFPLSSLLSLSSEPFNSKFLFFLASQLLHHHFSAFHIYHSIHDASIGPTRFTILFLVVWTPVRIIHITNAFASLLVYLMAFQSYFDF